MEKHITTPITQKITKDLKSGDYVYITGEMYVARDAAHKRMIEALDRKEELPIDIKDSTIYYMGPSPARDGRPIGSAGPTTATRMDKYAPRLLDLGEKAMIGKGKRSKEVIDAVIRNKAVYFAAVGGAGALLSKCIKSSEVICYDDLGAEAIRKIYVEDFPVIVVIDSEGNNLYETSIKEFKKIYACEFYYNKSGNADWPKQVINFTTKTQFIFRISKGSLEQLDDKKLNSVIDHDDRRIPYRNMIYIGDGMTDVPCMKLVKMKGGESIAIYHKDTIDTAKRLFKDQRVGYICKADYSQNSELESIVKLLIEQMALTSKLVDLHKKHKEQYLEEKNE